MDLKLTDTVLTIKSGTVQLSTRNLRILIKCSNNVKNQK